MNDPVHGGPLSARLMRKAATRMIVGDLRKAFRRVVWVGDPPVLPPSRPVVIYANHHVYADSYLLFHLITQVLERPFLVWMEAWDKAPMFGPVGALPFPADDARQRVQTIRETSRRMESDPRSTLLLYPEGSMGVPEAGLAPFAADLPRLAPLLPESASWWPVGVRTSWWGESRPTALLHAGPLHDTVDGQEANRLDTALRQLESARPEDLETGRAHAILDGTPGPDERWNLSPLAPFFRRWTF
ncbi:MAG: acyltransferase [Rubricoccaceae bacterium]